MKKYFDGIMTPIGRVHIVATEGAVAQLYLPGSKWKERYVRAPRHPIILRTKRELREYFLGRRRAFSVPVILNGTPFQMKVWRALRRTRYGKTITYGKVAKAVGVPRAVRAAGSAIGANPIPIIIPCHRVVRSDGMIGGYAGGAILKARLLTLEHKHSL